ncbi:MAG: hypothetical protein V1926_04165 [Candidatus Peregrinibacteria bacterium]
MGQEVKKLLPMADQLKRTQQPIEHEVPVDSVHQKVTDILQPASEGDSYLAAGYVEKALQAYTFAKEQPPKLKLIAAGQQCLDRCDIDEAMLAYGAAGVSPPAGRLAAIGDECFPKEGVIHKDTMRFGIKAYAAAKDTAKLIAVGDRYRQDQFNYKIAIEAYSAANARAKLVAMGDLLAQDPTLMLHAALQAYIAAGSKDSAIALGDRYMHQYLHYRTVILAYTWAGAKDKLKAAGDYYTKMGLRSEAQEAYAAMSVERVSHLSET